MMVILLALLSTSLYPARASFILAGFFSILVYFYAVKKELKKISRKMNDIGSLRILDEIGIRESQITVLLTLGSLLIVIVMLVTVMGMNVFGVLSQKNQSLSDLFGILLAPVAGILNAKRQM